MATGPTNIPSTPAVNSPTSNITYLEPTGYNPVTGQVGYVSQANTGSQGTEGPTKPPVQKQTVPVARTFNPPKSNKVKWPGLIIIGLLVIAITLVAWGTTYSRGRVR